MERDRPQNAAPPNIRHSPWLAVGLVGCLVVLVLAIFLPRVKSPPGHSPPVTAKPAAERAVASSLRQAAGLRGQRAVGAAAQEPAAQIVARKASQFAQAQWDICSGMARKHNVTVPPEVERFFAAAKAGNWEQLQASFEAVRAARQAQPHPPALDQLWGPVLATFNGLEQVHLWPPQEYLDYGNAVLGSLRPGMVYVGGTDPGRGIPELLNASEGEQHVVITQNGLADGNYMDYLRYLYGDKLALPTPEEVQKAFSDYLADAQKRYQHDQQFPDEPPQLKPGENISMDNGRASVSGQVGVMAINELILQSILQKNPTLSFGLEESFPLKSTYGEAAPLGPIMELRAQDGPNAMTADTAGQSLAYWQDTAQQVLSDPAAANSPEWLRAYSKMVDAQANLFISHGLNDQAEEAFRLSLQFCPFSPEAVYGYVTLLTGQNRFQDALAVAQAGVQADPNNKGFQNLIQNLTTLSRAQPATAKR